MRFTPKNRSSKGFTLVEVLVISPLLVILVAVMIGFFISLTRDALIARERNSLVYSVQNALNQIESDVRLSTAVPYATGTLPSGQGSNSSFTGTSQFVSSANVLILELRATDKNPLDPSRSLLYYADTPNPCTGGVGPEYNDVVRHQVIYFLDGTDLTRRTIVNFNGQSVCGVGTSPNSTAIYQHNTCKTTDNATCYARDAIVATGVSDIDFKYYLSRSSTTATNPTSNTNFVSVQTTVTGQKQVAGTTISQPSTLRAARIN